MLVIHGDHDLCQPLARAQRLAELLPWPRAAEYPGLVSPLVRVRAVPGAVRPGRVSRSRRDSRSPGVRHRVPAAVRGRWRHCRRAQFATAGRRRVRPHASGPASGAHGDGQRPRIEPKEVSDVEGLEKRGYLPDLFEHLACADAAVVQGGLSTTMELVALRRPFIYFPLPSGPDRAHSDERWGTIGHLRVPFRGRPIRTGQSMRGASHG
jgi:hypothetical protein